MDFLQPQPPAIPRVVVPQRVIDRMVEETLAHPETETGETVFGIELPGMLVVLGTIPDIVDTHRSPGFFRQGGDDQWDIYKWVRAHWDEMRKASRGTNRMTGWIPQTPVPLYAVPAELDAPIRFIGDWHRHPGGYKQLSGTDLGTIDSILQDPKAKRSQYLAPLVTMSKLTLSPHFRGSELVVAAGDEIQIQFYWKGRDTQDYYHVVPEIIPDGNLPWIPPIPWHLMDPNRLRTELALLQQAGCTVGYGTQQMDGDPILEVVFGITHPDWKERVMLVTDWDFPRSKPTHLLLPMESDVPVAPKPAPATPAPVQVPVAQPTRSGEWDIFEAVATFFRKLFNGRPAPAYHESHVYRPAPIVRDWGKNLVDFVEELVRKGEIHVVASTPSEDPESHRD